MASRAELLEKLNAIRKAYAEKLPAKVQECRTMFATLDGAWNPAVAREIQSRIHRLAGSGGTFGFKLVTTSARAIEQLFDSVADARRDPDAEEWEELERLFAALAQASQQQDADGPRLPEQRTASSSRLPMLPERHVLFLCHDPAKHADWLEEVAPFGFHVACMRDAQSFDQRIALQAPRAVLLDLDCGVFGVDAERMRSIEREAGRPVPLIVLASSVDLRTRLRAVRLGGRYFLNLPVDSLRLADILAATDAEHIDPIRVVVVDDDQVLAAQYGATFENAGMRSTPVHRPDDLIRTLVELHPDVLVMSLTMHEVSGLELAGVVRQHDAFAGLPIVFLSVEASREQQIAALDLGDDFLARPIDGGQLVSVVTARAQRARSMQASLTRDGLTGLLQASSFRKRLEREVLWAARQGSDFALVLLDLDDLRGLNGSHGHLVGDRALQSLARQLKQRLRRTDIMGRCRPRDFGVLMMQADVHKAHELIDGLRERLLAEPFQVGDQALSLSLSAGVASFSRHCEPEALLAAAERALSESKSAGGNRVTVAS